tara:strand:- start:15436 stop:16473 length:1038 start_codon:yes stop_codon:yes gene_type:complete
MTHELKAIFEAYRVNKANGFSSALVTVVDLNGSSYRKPGVRMLINSNNQMTGAVSGGCVEKEILRQAIPVFKTDVAVIMTYDGRFRIGCEGLLYILIEPFKPSEQLLNAFQNAINQRDTLRTVSHYTKETGLHTDIGTSFQFDEEWLPVYPHQVNQNHPDYLAFQHALPPCFRLYIMGGEHDAQQLAQQAAFMGWEVEIILPVAETQPLSHFKGATAVHGISPEEMQQFLFDSHTAVVLMSHNFAKDLHYLMQFHKMYAAKETSSPMYMGVLGSKLRMEQLMNGLLERIPDVDEAFLATLHGPAGLAIGAITPQEISVSIISEIVSLLRDKEQTEVPIKSVVSHD